MKLQLTKPIVFFDLETTGVDTTNDHIVELCYIRVEPNGNEEARSMRINPGVHIPEEASQVHGIYDEDVKDCPTFPQVAPMLKTVFEGSDIAGFNSNHFDVPMLVQEFLSCSIDIDLSQSRLVDVQNIYHKLERRTLSAAYLFYCGKDLENAHSALADTRATYEVLEAQLDRYPDVLKNDVAFLSDFSRRSNNVDFAGRVVYDDNGLEVINFGKYRNMPVRDIVRRDPGYFSWIQQSDFPLNTKRVFEQLRLKYASR